VEAIMLSSVKGTLNKYAVFSGKANRSEYWTFYLFCSFVLIVSGFLGALLGNESISNILTGFFICPIIACGIRRMHDVGKSGWFLFIPVYNFILLITPSKPSNQS
jgi:uncharacterized membrane protein YhaH (DUF805 family)